MMKKLFFAICLGMFLIFNSSAILAQRPNRPARNVSPRRHPNLAAAQRFSQQAYNKIIAAQQANEWDLKGHAQKAKELLDQVNSELKLAAEASNER